jgi:hypothetical protein
MSIRPVGFFSVISIAVLLDVDCELSFISQHHQHVDVEMVGVERKGEAQLDALPLETHVGLRSSIFFDCDRGEDDAL